MIPFKERKRLLGEIERHIKLGEEIGLPRIPSRIDSACNSELFYIQCRPSEDYSWSTWIEPMSEQLCGLVLKSISLKRRDLTFRVLDEVCLHTYGFDFWRNGFNFF